MRNGRLNVLDVTLTELIIFILLVACMAFAVAHSGGEASAGSGTRERLAPSDPGLVSSKVLRPYSCYVESGRKDSKAMYSITIVGEDRVEVRSLVGEALVCPDFLALNRSKANILDLEMFKEWAGNVNAYGADAGNCFGRQCIVYADFRVCRMRDLPLAWEVVNRDIALQNIGAWYRGVENLNRKPEMNLCGDEEYQTN